MIVCYITTRNEFFEKNIIEIDENKTLKLQNLLSVKLDLESEDVNLINTEVKILNTYIQTHGARQIGPLIQYSSIEVNDEGEVDLNWYNSCCSSDN